MARWLVAFIWLAAAYAAVAAWSPPSVGVWNDDAIYVTTGRALAEGRGYRHLEMPGEPLQTKYPIAYPAILALAWRVWPSYPSNVPLLLLPGALAAAGMVLLALAYLRDALAARPEVTWAAAVLTAGSPVILSFVRFTMSDLVYGALALAALFVFDRKLPAAQPGRARFAWLAAGVLLVVLAVLTRGIGVSLLGAALAAVLTRRAWRDAALIAVLSAALLAPWWIRQAAAQRSNGLAQTARLTAADLGYAMWAPRSAEQTARVIWQNGGRVLFGLAYFQLALPADWVMGAVARGTWSGGSVALHMVAGLAGALLLFGLVRSARGGIRTVHWYVLGYGGMMLAWPYEPYRFLIPWTPLLLYWLLNGAAGCAETVGRRLPAGAGGWRSARRAARVGLAICVVPLAVLFLIDGYRVLRSVPADYYLRETPVDWDEVRAVERWVSAHTVPDAVIASTMQASLFLATGRRGVYYWPDTDPYALYYGPERTFRTFYAAPCASEAAFALGEMRADLLREYRAAGVTHLVHDARVAPDLAALTRDRPELAAALVPRFTSPRRTFRIFELTPVSGANGP